MTSLYVALVGLLDVDTWARRAAVLRADSGQPAARFALRRVLWQDRDAGVRAAAALQLGRTKTQSDSPTVDEVASWLGDACGDASPLVREAALRALSRAAGRLQVPSRIDRAKQAAALAQRDPIWWVRRAALLSYGALLSSQPERAIALLRERLGDPFWRVRHAAAQALYAIGLRIPTLRESIVAPDPSLLGPAQAGLWYLRARFQPAIDVHSFSPSHPDGPLLNADPAVTTARLRAQPAGSLDPRALVSFFADPHEPLRRLAVERLRTLVQEWRQQHGSESAEVQGLLRELLPWLETPSQPHAAETTALFLDSLGAPARALCQAVLADNLPSVGALGWAASYAAQIEDDALLPALLRHSLHPKPTARAAVMAALTSLLPRGEGKPQAASTPSDDTQPPEGPLAAWGRGLADENIEVRSLALLGIAQHDSPTLHALALRQSLASLLPAARLALVDLALRQGQPAVLTRALRDPHPLVRARALRALRSRGELSPSTIESAWTSRDPEARLAVLPALPEAWLTALKDDPEPLVRRSALRALLSKRGREVLGEPAQRQAALWASTAADPWLRTEAAAQLQPGSAAELVALLRLSRDSEESVRAAAADGLQDPASVPGLRALLHSANRDAALSLSGELRAAAYAWVVAHEGEGALDLLTAAQQLAAEPAAVRQLVPALRVLAHADSKNDNDDAALLDGGTAESAQPIERAQAVPTPVVNRRVLGRTGIQISPLGLSGAYEPPLSALQRARQAGVNLFFWEPGYLKLTRFLRRQCQLGPQARGEMVIVAGSFEADRVGIEHDVARALRRLRTSYLDVLLLLWVRSPERLSQEALDCLRELKRRGTIRAFGFSTHQRELAESAARTGDWDVLMLRHSAAHPGAEDRLLPLCAEKQIGVITFSALSYGRLLRPQPTVADRAESPARDGRGGAQLAADETGSAQMVSGTGEQIGPLPTAVDCYRYTLSQTGVSACWSAPRSAAELAENLAVLSADPLPAADCERLRRQGELVHAEDRRFRAFLRKGHDGAPEILAQLATPVLAPAPASDGERAGITGEAAAAGLDASADLSLAESLAELAEAGAPFDDPALPAGEVLATPFDPDAQDEDDAPSRRGSETGEAAQTSERSGEGRARDRGDVRPPGALWSATWPPGALTPSGSLRSLLSRRRKPEKM